MNRHINLLPAQLQRQELIRGQAVRWTVIGALAIAVQLLQIGFVSRRLHSERAQAAVLEERGNELRQVEQKSQQFGRQIEAFTGPASLLSRVDGHLPSVQFLGLVSDGAKRQNGQLIIRSMEVKKSASNAGVSAARATYLLSIQGAADNDQLIADFISHLRESQIFANVELKSSLAISSSEMTSRQFAIECF